MTFFLIAGICLLLLLLSVMIADNHRFVIRRYGVSSPQTGGEYTFVFLSDLHAKKYGKDNEKLLRAIDRIHPDAVLVGGDMIIAAQAMQGGKKLPDYGRAERKSTQKTEGGLTDTTVHENGLKDTKVYGNGTKYANVNANGNEQEYADDWMQTTISLMKCLTSKYPVCYVNGNHELKLHWHREFCEGAYERLMTALEETGIICLHNRALTWHFEAEDAEAAEKVQKVRDPKTGKKRSIVFYGLELDYPFYKKFHKETLTVEEIERHIGRPDPDCFTILITHNPRYFESYAAWGADLVLCGHVHGGIARLPFLGGVISPYITLFPKYSGGRYVLPGKNGKESVMILSCGLGMHTLPVRFFNPAELSVIELKQQSRKRI